MRKWRMGLVGAAAAAMTLGLSSPASATTEDTAEGAGGTIVIEESPRAGDEAGPGARGNDCTLGVCGVAHNRTGKTLQVHRDSSSHWSCQPTGDKRRNLKSGKSSNQFKGWKDTDCVRSTKCKIVFRGSVYQPGDWIRLYNPTWFYNVNC